MAEAEVVAEAKAEAKAEAEAGTEAGAETETEAGTETEAKAIFSRPRRRAKPIKCVIRFKFQYSKS